MQAFGRATLPIEGSLIIALIAAFGSAGYATLELASAPSAISIRVEADGPSLAAGKDSAVVAQFARQLAEAP